MANNGFDACRYISQVPYAAEVDDKKYSSVQIECRETFKRAISLSEVCATAADQDPITGLLAHFQRMCPELEDKRKFQLVYRGKFSFLFIFLC